MTGGIIIPVYKHGKACAAVVDGLSQYSYPIMLVDDGNDGETQAYLRQIADSHPAVTLVTLPKNRGKGGAVMAGITKAHEMGWTHALQIDADGQHDLTRALFFFAQAAANPAALICGYPEYDASVPAHRKNGRKFANTWAKIVSFERDIVDTMCGFRVYPVEPTLRVFRHSCCDKRMGFDIEILIRLIWAGVPYLFFPVRVTYPADGVSNFHVVRDNMRISWVYTRLCIGMILRLPFLLAKMIRRKRAP
ncbi:MAG: glycosyltransferase family 2 protein [Treponemataceae bacterium]|nr:glycosyltransferase family 2 protein [Treponemataceae bacterium]